MRRGAPSAGGPRHERDRNRKPRMERLWHIEYRFTDKAGAGGKCNFDLANALPAHPPIILLDMKNHLASKCSIHIFVNFSLFFSFSKLSLDVLSDLDLPVAISGFCMFFPKQFKMDS